MYLLSSRPNLISPVVLRIFLLQGLHKTNFLSNYLIVTSIRKQSADFKTMLNVVIDT